MQISKDFSPNKKVRGQRSRTSLFFTILLVLLFSACQPGPFLASRQNPSATFIPAPPSATSSPSLTPSQTATLTEVPSTATQTPVPVPSDTPSATPFPPPMFNTKLLRSGVSPQSYLDPCRYLKLRWSPASSPPNTVVVPIMFHGIIKSGRPVDNSVDIPVEQFQEFVTYAHYLGYETITTSQLIDFLENNAIIPPRSMIMIIDDRRLGTVREHFMPVLKEYNWTLTLGYISGVVPDSEWADMENLASSGLLDVQAHGWLHNGATYIQQSTPEDVIRQEIVRPIAVLQKHTGYRPTAFIWPGGDYNSLGVQIAREAGYKLGFTANSRGPLLFNWIPLGAEEEAMQDPLMVLPRFWSRDAGLALDLGVQAGEQAAAYARSNYPKEARWYSAACGGELPPLPTPTAGP